MRRTAQPEMAVIRDLGEIPVFDSEPEEAHFWDTHTFSPELLARFQSMPHGVLPTRSRARPVVIRLQQQAFDELKRLAAQKHKRYQTLLREFVLERLREEQRCQSGTEIADSGASARRPRT